MSRISWSHIVVGVLMLVSGVLMFIIPHNIEAIRGVGGVVGFISVAVILRAFPNEMLGIIDHNPAYRQRQQYRELLERALQDLEDWELASEGYVKSGITANLWSGKSTQLCKDIRAALWPNQETVTRKIGN